MFKYFAEIINFKVGFPFTLFLSPQNPGAITLTRKSCSFSGSIAFAATKSAAAKDMLTNHKTRTRQNNVLEKAQNLRA